MQRSHGICIVCFIFLEHILFAEWREDSIGKGNSDKMIEVFRNKSDVAYFIEMTR